jgi:hypothetical protein
VGAAGDKHRAVGHRVRRVESRYSLENELDGERMHIFVCVWIICWDMMTFCC